MAKDRKQSTDIPPGVWKRLEQHFKQESFPFRNLGAPLPKPASFGVYLGPLPRPANSEVQTLLNRYDLLVLDPSQHGVLSTLADRSVKLPPHVVARLDLYQMLSVESMKNENQLFRSLERILAAIQDTLLRKPGEQSAFTGISLAGWHNLMSTPLLNALAQYLSQLGLNVYLEVVPPHFMDGMKRPDFSLFAGVIVRNGTILPNGEVRDYFQMEKMKSTVREFVSQSCLRQFIVMMWDPVDDRIEVSHAVVKRAYTWCSYHGSLLWVGSIASQTHPESNFAVLEPLSAFQWLKEQKVMDIHDAYRTTRLVSD
jgi:hypothetical protein